MLFVIVVTAALFRSGAAARADLVLLTDTER